MSGRKILHVVQSLGTGGLENGVVNLANGIDETRFELDILCLRYEGELVARLHRPSRVFFDGRTAASIREAGLAVRRICRERQYDIVHTHGWATLLAGFLGARSGGNARIINGEHGTFFVDTARRRLAQKILLRLVDGHCSVSASLREEMCSMFAIPESAVTVILNGVDVQRFRPAPDSGVAIRQSLGIGPGETVFGTVGRLVPVKDYSTLVTAFGRLCAACPHARLLLVGDGPQLASLRSLSGEFGIEEKVIFAGNRDDVPSLMGAMDVFCLTSIREGLSNTLLEAHACGLPVVATATGGNAEIVVHEKTGFLFDVADYQRLADLMIALAVNPELRGRLGHTARERAVKDFSIARMVRAYEEMYERILGE